VSLGRVAPCWWTRTIVESIDAIQSTSPPLVSHRLDLLETRAQTPTFDQRSKFL
jgi:hypothetical protein